MQVRNLQNSDIPILLDMHIKSGLEYEFPDLRSAHMEAVKVVVSEDGIPLMAAAAERLLQAYLFCGEFEHPAAKLAAVTMLHHAMAPELRARGYRDLNAFVPPCLMRFTRRLTKLFGWEPSWPGFFIRF